MGAAPPGRILLDQLMDPMQAFSLHQFLLSHDLPVTLPEPPLRTALGGVPFDEAVYRLYLEDPSRLEEARRLIRQFRQGDTEPLGGPWRCPGCGEAHGPEFDSCWNCGADRPE